MSNDIKTGIDKIAETMNFRSSEEIANSWRTMRNKLDSMLLASRALKSDDIMIACRLIDNMSTSEREQHILTIWGKLYLDRARPILTQLQILEDAIAKNQDA